MKNNWKEKKRILAGALAMSMVLAACGQSGATGSSNSGSSEGKSAGTTEGSSALAGESSKDPITFKYFNPDPAVHAPGEDAPVLQQVTDATGVSFDWDVPVSDAVERMNIMLASGDMPDLINFSYRLSDKTLLNQFISGGYLVDLKDLMKEYAPNAYKNLSEVLPKVMDQDGHLWILPGRYTFPDSQPVAEARIGVNFSSEYFDENGWDGLPSTLPEYEEVLKTIKANTDMMPLGLALGANGMYDSVLEAGAGAYGLTYSDKLVLENDELKYFTQVPEMKEYCKWLNGLYLQGLMDPESAILSEEMLQEKIVGEKVWSYIGRGRWINNALNSHEQSEGTSARAATAYPKANDSVDQVTYTKYTENLLTGGVAITTACKNPERILELYEYLNTEEGHMNAIGITNYDWDGTPEGEEGYDLVVTDQEYIEGRPVVENTDWSAAQWGADSNWWWKRGREMLWDFTYAGDGVNYPGGKYDMIGNMDVSVWWDDDMTRVYNELGFTGEDYVEKHLDMACDVTNFSGLDFPADSQEYMEYLDMEKTVETMIPRTILAESEAEFETQWSALEAELAKNGLDHVMTAYNELMKTRLATWEKNAQ